MNVTALTVAREPTSMAIPGAVHRCLSGRIFKSAADVQRAWFDAVELVRTPYFFFIDDDDSVPAELPEVLESCIKSGAAVCYTDEMVGPQRRIRQDYSQEAHLSNPTLVHHLVLCETSTAKAAMRDLPRGHFWPEMLLFWQMAKIGGAAHIPEVGYHWNKKDKGLHSEWFTVFGMANSRAWCEQNR